MRSLSLPLEGADGEKYYLHVKQLEVGSSPKAREEDINLEENMERVGAGLNPELGAPDRSTTVDDAADTIATKDPNVGKDPDTYTDPQTTVAATTLFKDTPTSETRSGSVKRAIEVRKKSTHKATALKVRNLRAGKGNAADLSVSREIQRRRKGMK